MERETLWRKIVDLQYGSMRGGWGSNTVQGTYGTSLWKSIRKGSLVWRYSADDKISRAISHCEPSRSLNPGLDDL